mgnify:CR=1 FL=1
MKRQMPVFMGKGGTYMTIIYEKEQLSEIIAAVQAGQTIAFPTDTVYGLGVISTDAQALERLKAGQQADPDHGGKRGTAADRGLCG